jgi:hypothetical protein
MELGPYQEMPQATTEDVGREEQSEKESECKKLPRQKGG